MVLSLLSRHPESSFTLSEICHQLDLNVSTAHSLLNALTDARFLVRQPRTKRYSLGPELVRIGSAAANRHVRVTDAAREHIAALASELGRQCVASTVIGDEIVLLAKAGRPGVLGLTMDVGQRLAYLPPFGTVFAAWSDEETIRDWLGRIGELSPELTLSCLKALSAVRHHGYSVGLTIDAPLETRLWSTAKATRSAPRRRIDPVTTQSHELFEQVLLDEYFLTEFDPAEHYRVGNISAPVFDADGTVVLAVAVPYFSELLTGAEITDNARLLIDVAARVTATIQGSVPVEVAHE
ncbi:MAG: transcriptional regulator, IclR family [Pseudonocardiales bacterium]|nr:transcriptional regulator, IclR family [Pseudonocardiales bacterium]